ncbi:MAG: hypothetical protein ACK5UN_01525, partial [Planctomycetota bacterium]
AFAPHLELHAFLNACWDINVQGFFPFNSTCSTTFGTMAGYDLATTTAGWAGEAGPAAGAGAEGAFAADLAAGWNSAIASPTAAN